MFVLINQYIIHCELLLIITANVIIEKNIAIIECIKLSQLMLTINYLILLGLNIAHLENIFITGFNLSALELLNISPHYISYSLITSRTMNKQQTDS